MLELPLGAHRLPMNADADSARVAWPRSVNFGLMVKRPVPDGIMDAWLAPSLGSSEIRRDLLKYLRATRRGEYVEAAGKLAGLTKPALVRWGPENAMMRPENGGGLVEVADSFTLMPEDQPQVCAKEIRSFVTGP
ncbi:hypothetical protein QLQ12_42340 [Actinoplanes sp. NEAU-A12]|uniref:Uncharacterized protein n=1 Tax=Actinoplanes sandaracinus TaxID=3045177 RepID=A0ABT6WZR7_9ACTN|nr:hypothetical protein [Actinoplanes sandaracinus]MDI6105243.1 hypothetical protein [Actinoplanes sandaracinus]